MKKNAAAAQAEETRSTGQMLDFFEARLKTLTKEQGKVQLAPRSRGDVADHSRSSEEQHNTLALHNHRAAMINAVNSALKMLRCGEWDGIHCYNDRCGVVIPFRRQEIAPGIYCVSCQSALEKAAKQKGR